MREAGRHPSIRAVEGRQKRGCFARSAMARIAGAWQVLADSARSHTTTKVALLPGIPPAASRQTTGYQCCSNAMNLRGFGMATGKGRVPRAHGSAKPLKSRWCGVLPCLCEGVAAKYVQASLMRRSYEVCCSCPTGLQAGALTTFMTAALSLKPLGTFPLFKNVTGLPT